MKKFEITVLQNATTGSLVITCNDPRSYLSNNRVVQVYSITDTSKDGRPSTNARQSIKTRTSGYLQQYDSTLSACNEVENMITTLDRFSIDGCLTITKKFDKPLHKLVAATVEKLKKIKSKLNLTSLINNESHCVYLYFDPLKLTMSFAATPTERDNLSLMHTYVCDSTEDKRILLSTIKTTAGTLKSIPINQSILMSIHQQITDYTNKSDKTTIFDLFNFIRGVSKPIE